MASLNDFSAIMNFGNNQFSNPNIMNSMSNNLNGLNDYKSILKFNMNQAAQTPSMFDGFGDFMKGALGKDGWGMPALQGIGMIGGLMGGLSQQRMAKKQMSHARRMDNINLENQRKLTNAALEDRQKARVAANPNAESVDSHMKKYGV